MADPVSLNYLRTESSPKGHWDGIDQMLGVLSALCNIPQPVSSILLGQGDVPTQDDDSDSGFAAGTIWVTSAGGVYQAVDVTPSAADWQPLNMATTSWVLENQASIPSTSDIALSAHAAADSGPVGDTPVVVPIDTADHARDDFAHAVVSNEVVVQADVGKVEVEFFTSTYLSLGVAATVKHVVKKNGVDVPGSAAFSDAPLIGLGNARSTSGSCVVDLQLGDAIGVYVSTTGPGSTIKTLGGACRMKITRIRET